MRTFRTVIGRQAANLPEDCGRSAPAAIYPRSGPNCGTFRSTPAGQLAACLASPHSAAAHPCPWGKKQARESSSTLATMPCPASIPIRSNCLLECATIRIGPALKEHPRGRQPKCAPKAPGPAPPDNFPGKASRPPAADKPHFLRRSRGCAHFSHSRCAIQQNLILLHAGGVLQRVQNK